MPLVDKSALLAAAIWRHGAAALSNLIVADPPGTA